MLLKHTVFLWLKLQTCRYVSEGRHTEQVIENDVTVHPKELNRQRLLKLLRQCQRLIHDLFPVFPRLRGGGRNRNVKTGVDLLVL